MTTNSSPVLRRSIQGVIDSESGMGRARAASEALCEAGAVAMLSEEPRPILVGDLRWVTPREVLLFTAHGDSPADAYRLTFDEAVINESGSVILLQAGHVAGTLHRIEDADVDNPDDYRIAWELWQEVAALPLSRELIERCYQASRRANGD